MIAAGGVRVRGWLITFVVGLLALGLPGHSQSTVTTTAIAGGDDLPARVRGAIERVLVDRDGSDRQEVSLLALGLTDGRLTLNLSRDLLDYGPGSLEFEQWSRRLHRAIGDVLSDHLPSYEIFTLIDGVPLHRLLEDVEPRVASRRIAAAPPVEIPAVRPALLGRRIAVSPGHGAYLNGSIWGLQRPMLFGIVEDYVNWDLVSHLTTALRAVGADVRPTRNLDKSAGVGESGYAKWQEAARYHLKAIGVEEAVWNEAGVTHLNQDIRCRPRYANSVGADILVSIHNNAAPTPGVATGTETLYDTGNGFGAESKRLAEVVHAKIIAAIRSAYAPTWADRRVQGFNGDYGENRLATRPAILIELAFMDRPAPDNTALQNEAFKILVANAIKDGVQEYLEGPAATVPAAATALLATGSTAAIALAWADNSANETGFQIERKNGASGSWDPLAIAAANATSYTDSAVVAGTTYHYRVRATNASGASILFSNEASATTAAVLVLAVSAPAAGQTRASGQDVVFTATVTDPGGVPVPGVVITGRDGMRNAAFSSAPQVTDAGGQFTFRSTVPNGQTPSAYDFTFAAARAGYVSSATVARQAQTDRAPGAALGAPTFLIQPAARRVRVGDAVTLATGAIGAAPLTYQWRFNGTDIPGATAADYRIAGTTAAHAGTYSVVASNAVGATSSLAAAVIVAPAAWLSNVAVRTTLADAQTVIVGFAVAGGAKEILVRAAGPTLTQFGLTTILLDPRLALFDGAMRIGENNDWTPPLAPMFAGLGAFAFPASSRDAALLHPVDGGRSVHASGNGPGVVLIEGYDAGLGGEGRLINLSARNRVGTGADILIAGFFVAGTGEQRLLVRAVGPALSAFGVTGVLADPRLELFDANAVKVAENDNWDPALAATGATVGAFPLTPGSRDSALLVTLAAGRSYSAQVSGVGGTAGEALIEVYEIP